jgi:uncharacterized protein (TIGR03067 family)
MQNAGPLSTATAPVPAAAALDQLASEKEPKIRIDRKSNGGVIMKTAALLMLVEGCLLSSPPFATAADDAKQHAIKQDRKKYQGTWRVVSLQVDGKPALESDAKKITVVNHVDGTWSIRVDDKEIAKGTSEIDPTQNPKTIDFTPSEGSERGKLFLGIYEIKGDSRKLCYAPTGRQRPSEFSSQPGSGHVLVVFEREKP